MVDLNFKEILVIFIICLNSILSVYSHNEKQLSQNDKTNQQIQHHQPQYRLEQTNHHSSKFKKDDTSARYLDEDVDEFDNDSSEINPNPNQPSSSSATKLGAQSTHDIWERKSKPLRNIFMGIYKNYKSTYLGNRTSLEYRKSMNDGGNSGSGSSGSGWTTPETSGFKKKSGTKLYTVAKPLLKHSKNDNTDDDDDGDNDNDDDYNNDEIRRQATTTTSSNDDDNNKYDTDINHPLENSDHKNDQNAVKRTKLKRKKKKKKKKNKGSVVKKDEPLLYSFDGEYRYNIGPGVNISLDMRKDVVSVNLDEECLREILLGRWVDENEGRGKKYEMISKILPLFILPFLIQSAIIPFLVTKLKLLLIKSILVGKLAIFLLVISAIKNNQKVATYEPAPAYWAPEPSRRSEIYNGYRVEGRPTTWLQ